ncbi:hypothetical protein EDD22DRAFT_957760 [Suillus occidentalis]|nr:hypothetical protein EDD22DRAFT_957760 [Suillus occidentalis]
MAPSSLVCDTQCIGCLECRSCRTLQPPPHMQPAHIGDWTLEQLVWLEDQNPQYLYACETDDLLTFWPFLFEGFLTCGLSAASYGPPCPSTLLSQRRNSVLCLKRKSKVDSISRRFSKARKYPDSLHTSGWLCGHIHDPHVSMFLPLCNNRSLVLSLGGTSNEGDFIELTV